MLFKNVIPVEAKILTLDIGYSKIIFKLNRIPEKPKCVKKMRHTFETN